MNDGNKIGKSRRRGNEIPTRVLFSMLKYPKREMRWTEKILAALCPAARPLNLFPGRT
jgi:hypothetical protein